MPGRSLYIQDHLQGIFMDSWQLGVQHNQEVVTLVLSVCFFNGFEDNVNLNPPLTQID